MATHSKLKLVHSRAEQSRTIWAVLLMRVLHITIYKRCKKPHETYPSSWALACLSSRWPWPCRPHLRQEACSDGPWCLWRRWCTGSWHLTRKDRQWEDQTCGSIKNNARVFHHLLRLNSTEWVAAISPTSNGVHCFLPWRLARPLSRTSECFKEDLGRFHNTRIT